MKQKYAVLAALSIILLILIAGCEGNKKETGEESPYIGGTEGLAIKFIDGSPPSKVTDGGRFPFKAIVSIKNMGEYTINPGEARVNIEGIDPADFSVTAPGLLKILDTSLVKKRKINNQITDPSETYVNFPSTGGSFNYIRSSVGDATFILRANVCYKYQASARSNICILQNLIDVPTGSICNPRETKKVYSSGSPVVVTSFLQEVEGLNRIRFNFDIEHVGKGVAFLYDGAVSCPEATRRERENKVRVTVNTGMPGLMCYELEGGTTSGVVTLINNRKIVTCVQDLPPNRVNNPKPIDIVLDFNYLDTNRGTPDEGKILVQHLPGTALGACPDSYCDYYETSATCPQDCLITVNCNYDGSCGASETNALCPHDCRCNNDGDCDAGETNALCPNECPATGTTASGVSTLAATDITRNTTKLKGSVNPNGVNTYVWFNYSNNPGLSSPITTPATSVGSGTSQLYFEQQIPDLTPATTYYFKAYAGDSNKNVYSSGVAMYFTTLS